MVNASVFEADTVRFTGSNPVGTTIFNETRKVSMLFSKLSYDVTVAYHPLKVSVLVQIQVGQQKGNKFVYFFILILDGSNTILTVDLILPTL